MGKKISLTKAQESTLQSLGLSLNGPEAQKLLALNEQREAVVQKNRSEFSISVNENGNMVFRGLGNRFPTGLRPDSVLILCDHVDDMRKIATELLTEAKAATPKV